MIGQFVTGKYPVMSGRAPSKGKSNNVSAMRVPQDADSGVYLSCRMGPTAVCQWGLAQNVGRTSTKCSFIWKVFFSTIKESKSASTSTCQEHEVGMTRSISRHLTWDNQVSEYLPWGQRYLKLSEQVLCPHYSEVWQVWMRVMPPSPPNFPWFPCNLRLSVSAFVHWILLRFNFIFRCLTWNIMCFKNKLCNTVKILPPTLPQRWESCQWTNTGKRLLFKLANHQPIVITDYLILDFVHYVLKTYLC